MCCDYMHQVRCINLLTSHKFIEVKKKLCEDDKLIIYY